MGMGSIRVNSLCSNKSNLSTKDFYFQNTIHVWSVVYVLMIRINLPKHHASHCRPAANSPRWRILKQAWYEGWLTSFDSNRIETKNRWDTTFYFQHNSHESLHTIPVMLQCLDTVLIESIIFWKEVIRSIIMSSNENTFHVWKQMEVQRSSVRKYGGYWRNQGHIHKWQSFLWLTCRPEQPWWYITCRQNVSCHFGLIFTRSYHKSGA